MNTIAPGWYDDGAGSIRWWDGTAWTGHVQPQAPATGFAAPAQVPVLPASDAAAAAALAEPYPTRDQAAQAQAARQTQPGRSGTVRLIAVIAIVVIVALSFASYFAVAALIRNTAEWVSSVPFSEGQGGGGDSEGQGGGGDSGAESSGPDVMTAVEPRFERVVRDYNIAIETSDCELFERTTSEEFRANPWGYTGCDSFAELTAPLNEGVSDYRIEYEGQYAQSEYVVEVQTTERYLYDGHEYEDSFTYEISVQTGGRLAITDSY